MIPEVRELFGLYDNPAQLAAMTVGKLSNLVENYRFFNRLLETDAVSGENYLVLLNQQLLIRKCL